MLIKIVLGFQLATATAQSNSWSQKCAFAWSLCMKQLFCWHHGAKKKKKRKKLADVMKDLFCQFRSFNQVKSHISNGFSVKTFESKALKQQWFFQLKFDFSNVAIICKELTSCKHGCFSSTFCHQKKKDFTATTGKWLFGGNHFQNLRKNLTLLELTFASASFFKFTWICLI